MSGNSGTNRRYRILTGRMQLQSVDAVVNVKVCDTGRNTVPKNECRKFSQNETLHFRLRVRNIQYAFAPT